MQICSCKSCGIKVADFQAVLIDHIYKPTLDFNRAADFDSPVVRNLAVQIASQHPGYFNFHQVCDIFDFVYRKWRYVEDPRGKEYVAYASETIRNGTRDGVIEFLAGDCDDYSALVAALLLAIGGTPRLVVRCGVEPWCHIYPEVLMGRRGSLEFDQAIAIVQDRYRVTLREDDGFEVDGQGNAWLNLDWSAPHPGGSLYNGGLLEVIYL
jgi:transglutaminase-like putative cysteine protease